MRTRREMLALLGTPLLVASSRSSAQAGHAAHIGILSATRRPGPVDESFFGEIIPTDKVIE